MKKFFSVVLCVVLVLMANATAFATERNDMVSFVSEKNQVERAIKGISDVPITQEMRDAVTATYIKNGIEYPADVKMTVTRIPASKQKGDTSDTYALTVYASEKNSTDTGSEESVTGKVKASGSLTMYWTDVNILVGKNVLKAVGGSWTATSGATISERNVAYIVDSKSSNFQPTSNSFSKDINKEGQKLSCSSQFTARKDGEFARVILNVNPAT